VIGGLLLATVATLFFVPAFFAVVHGWLEGRRKTTGSATRAGTIDEFDELAE
jgi:HAE1 family hydrophobic/amphiphilic exporter-1